MSLDVSLTADVLRLANSAALGHRANITSVRDAAVRLGTSTLLSLTLASRVGGRMLQALPAYGLQPGALWERSVAASIAAEAWGLPLTIVDGIRDHHEAHEDLSAVSAAVALACAMSFEITTRDADPEEHESRVARRREVMPLMMVLHLDDDDYRAIVARSGERFDEVADRYGG